ncbi:translation initiation factor IF-2-like isoform X2 [Panthera uncia]|uniref:translation initiation factor IF-2-like isoform X2 n=1 Tax=Panthera uncia TaxID=29064 RepID=UPI0020FF95E3|nr:translation initiation factor IF-2-like isoform X2 [Panthera uncia]
MRPAGPPKSRTPAAPLYPILPDSHDLLSLDPPPYHPPPLAPQALPAAAAPPVAPLVAPLGEPGGQEAAAAPDWGRREVAAAPEPGGREAAAAPSPIENETNREGPAGRTRGRTQPHLGQLSAAPPHPVHYRGAREDPIRSKKAGSWRRRSADI